MFVIGDPTSLIIELSADPLQLTYILADNVGLSGIYVDYVDQINYVGWTGTQDLSLRFDLSTGKIQSFYNNNPKGVELDLINEVYYFGAVTTSGGATGFKAVEGSRLATMGDVDGNGNGTNFRTNDILEVLTGSANLLGTTGIGTSDRIKIKINGTDYLIVLETA